MTDIKLPNYIASLRLLISKWLCKMNISSESCVGVGGWVCVGGLREGGGSICMQDVEINI